jgi:hypothetical protein
MARTRYYIRAIDAVNPAVTPELRERLRDGLSSRFEVEPWHWEGLTITSVSHAHWSEAAHAEMHRRLGAMLDAIDPRWPEEFLVVPYSDLGSSAE